MNVLEITTVMRGGAGMFLIKLAQALKTKGHQVEVISAGESGELVDWEQLLWNLDADAIPHSNLNFFKRDNEIFWVETQKLAKIFQTQKYDIVHAQAGVPAYAAYVAKTMAGMNIPVIATFHSWGKDRPEWMNIADAWAFNQCDRVFYDSHEYMRFGQRKGVTADSGVIYPGLYVDTQKYLPSKELLRQKLVFKLGLPEDAKIITHLGEITERKGQLDLVKSIVGMDEVYVLLIGECRNENYRIQLNQFIEENDLNQRVKLLGWVDDPYEIITGSDLFVFPSYSEGLGLAPLEAMVLEIPTIFSLVEGTKDIANVLGESSFGTFAPGDYQEISGLIRKIFAQEKDFLQKAASLVAKRTMEIFGFEQTVRKYEKAMFEAAATIRSASGTFTK